jgi:hypothetical protein
MSMDIDLLISKTDDVGIVSTGKFDSPVTAAIFDHDTQLVSLEFGETMDTLVLNVPVGEDMVPYLIQRNYLFIIGTDKKHIHEAQRIPLMHVNNLLHHDVGEWK